MGFTFDDSGEADDDTPGIPSPIPTKECLIAEKPKNAKVIFPYIGGREVNDIPTHAHHDDVINFGGRSEEECRREWRGLMAITERKQCLNASKQTTGLPRRSGGSYSGLGLSCWLRFQDRTRYCKAQYISPTSNLPF